MFNKILIVPRNILFSLVLATLVSIVFIVVLNFIHIEKYQNYIPNNYLYINQYNVEIEEFLKESDATYCPTRVLNVNGEEKVGEVIQNPYPLMQKIYLTDMAYTKDTTKITILQNKEDIEIGQLQKEVNINYLYDCELKEDINIKENQNSIVTMILGRYPQNENEILISENYALKLLNENQQYKQYDDLIGQTIEISSFTEDKNNDTFDNAQFVISGIYAGGNELYILPNTETKSKVLKKQDNPQSAMLIKFKDKKTKELFIDQYLISNNIKYLDSSNTNKINTNFILKLMTIVGLAVIIFLILNTKLKELLTIQNYHSYSKLNAIYIYGWFAVIIILTFVVMLIQN